MNYSIYAVLTKGSNYSQTFVWDHFSELIYSSPERKNNFSRQYQFTQLIHVINFKEASGRFFFHFLEVFKKCIECKRIFFIHFLEISKFWLKVIYFRRILWLISWSLQDDQGGITCMSTLTPIINAVKEILSFRKILPSYTLVTKNIFNTSNLINKQFIHFKNGLLKNTTLIDNHAWHQDRQTDIYVLRFLNRINQ